MSSIAPINNAECPLEGNKAKTLPVTPLITRNNRCSERMSPRKVSATITDGNLKEHSSVSSMYNQHDVYPDIIKEKTNIIQKGRKDNIPSLMQRHLTFASQEDSVSEVPSIADLPSTNRSSCNNDDSCNRKSKNVLLNNTRVSSDNVFATQRDLCPVKTYTSVKDKNNIFSNKLPYSVTETSPLDTLKTTSLKSKCLHMPSSEFGAENEFGDIHSQNICTIASDSSQRTTNTQSIPQSCPISSSNPSSSFRISKNMVSAYQNRGEWGGCPIL